MIVNWNGNVLPCCAVSDEKTAIGNLISDELNNVWNSVKMRKCRIYLLNADAKLNFDSVCESCGVSKLNGKQ
jgi:radical SAM protein with 4Fe4S-binding SPASM domain